MASNDLTCLFLTVNKVPKKWAEFHMKTLKEATDMPIITLDQTGIEPSVENIYKQMLIGAKQAKTPYIAIVEDDVLYPKEHFDFRPPLDAFAYNMTRWSVLTWNPIYFYRPWRGNFALIAPRELMIEALEERFAKYPDGIPESLNGELGRHEKRLGVTPRKIVEFHTNTALVVFHHDYELDPLARSHRKGMGALRALEIPKWGRADDLAQLWTKQ